jgi:putative flippase GtrA
MAAPTARSGPVAAFVRFVVCGGGVTLLAAAALLLIGHRVPFALANAVVTVASTVLATELHGRFTFGRGGAGWSDHAAAGLTVALSYAFTTGALLAFDGLHPGGGVLLRQAVYLGASGLAGIARFLLLRHVVFAAPGAPRLPGRLLSRAARTGNTGRRAAAYTSGPRLLQGSIAP